MPFASLIISLAVSQSSGKATTLQFSGDRFSLPFEMVEDYMAIEGKVNGVSGKLIFDSSYETALRLNSNRIKNLGPSTSQAKAAKKLATVTIGPAKFSQTLQNVTGATYFNASFMESRMGKAFLGWMGFDYFSAGIVKLDFKAKQITLYRNTAKRSQEKDFLKGEQILVTIPFETRKLCGIPVVQAQIGSETFGGAFTTGQKGTLFMSTDTRQRLLDEEVLTRISEVEDSGMGNLFSVRVNKMSIGSFVSSDILEPLDSFDQPEQAKKAIGITEPNLIYLGTKFLSQYKTVWDYSAKKIYLLKR